MVREYLIAKGIEANDPGLKIFALKECEKPQNP
jgi:hypothetical protein